MSALITPSEAAELVARGAVLLDVQYQLGGPPSRELYAAGHLPGAAHLSVDDVLAGPPGEHGRHPLPDPGTLERAIRGCGVDDGSTVVVYDQRTSLAAARAWWTLRWAGLAEVRVIDGGMAAWEADGRALTQEVASFGQGTVTVRPGSLPVLAARGAARLAADGILLDVRAPERYLGESEPIDAVAGHIPGARNAPMSDLLAEDGRFLSPAKIRRYAATLGIDRSQPVGTSCGSGVTAAQMTLALHQAGIDSTPYIGSWSEWIANPARPVARGPE